MWTVIHMTQDISIARKICSLLAHEGFLVKMDEFDQISGKEKLFYEVFVLESEAEEAQAILLEQMFL
ncbi:MAG TPA: hypothetical protein GX526_00475 [Thermoanaerobacterales bacterium]|nr:hypothetical protein [Thermoanaerobacterales bacterium]